jgi:hypothetical protein
MQPFPSELEPPEADRTLGTLKAGTDIDADTRVPVVVPRALTDVLLGCLRAGRGAAGRHGSGDLRRAR